MRKSVLIPVLACLPLAAATQPYSESMADCAAQFQNAAQWMRDADRADALIARTRIWHGAAVAQSAREGRKTSDDAMWAKVDAKTEALEAKGGMYFFSEEFRDWTAYCRSFAKHTGVPDIP